MMLVMFAGMAVLGALAAALLALAGTSLAAGSPAVAALVMGFNMTAPMVWWMRRRGHAVRDSAEMAASMVVPTVVVAALHVLGVLPGEAVLAAQHLVMIPAMVGVMLWRYDHYAH